MIDIATIRLKDTISAARLTSARALLNKSCARPSANGALEELGSALSSTREHDGTRLKPAPSRQAIER